MPATTLHLTPILETLYAAIRRGPTEVQHANLARLLAQQAGTGHSLALPTTTYQSGRTTLATVPLDTPGGTILAVIRSTSPDTTDTSDLQIVRQVASETGRYLDWRQSDADTTTLGGSPDDRAWWPNQSAAAARWQSILAAARDGTLASYLGDDALPPVPPNERAPRIYVSPPTTPTGWHLPATPEVARSALRRPSHTNDAPHLHAALTRPIDAAFRASWCQCNRQIPADAPDGPVQPVPASWPPFPKRPPIVPPGTLPLGYLVRSLAPPFQAIYLAASYTVALDAARRHTTYSPPNHTPIVRPPRPIMTPAQRRANGFRRWAAPPSDQPD